MVEMLQFSKSYVSVLRISYGITPDDFKAIVEGQNGVCPLCLVSLLSTKLVVDHDGSSTTREQLKELPVSVKRRLVRGVLHYDCNVRLGWLEKFPWLVSDHVRKYLDTPPAQETLRFRDAPPDGRRRKRPKTAPTFRTVKGVKQKWCSGHQDWHPVIEFRVSSSRESGYARSCHDYNLTYWRKRNKERKGV